MHTLLLLLSLIPAAQPADSTRELRPVEISASRFALPLRSAADGTQTLQMSALHGLPHLMGNADPLHAAELLPGVQTTSEYDAGLHIWGADNGHNEVSVDGTPLYGVQHLLGFFSVFNAAHFQAMTFAPTVSMASTSNRLGGMLRMESPTTVPNHTTGEISIGPFSSQGTLRLPVRRHTGLVFSARETYMNLLYSRWLRSDENQLRYAFGDYNLTLLHEASERDDLSLNLYGGHDQASYEASRHQSETRARWGNLLANATHCHRFVSNATLRQTLFISHYSNLLSFEQEELRFRLPSAITDMGYRVQLQAGRWQGAIDASVQRVSPQSPELEGTYHVGYTPEPTQHVRQMSLLVGSHLPITHCWALHPALKGVLFSDDTQHLHFLPAPALSVEWSHARAGTIFLHVAHEVQPLFQTGLTSAGLPVEFWLAAGRHTEAQTAWHTSLTHEWVSGNGKWGLSASIYAKLLHHQIEYGGSLMDFISDRYELSHSLLHGRGYNLGCTLMLTRRTGPVTGWVSYAFTRSRRRFDEENYSGYYPSNHERPHELNAVATWRANNRWSFGATLAYCSGTPFTAAEHIYLINHKLMVEQGQHNACRLKPYGRLDLSANYDLQRNERRECGFNFSLYNATAHRNELYYRIRFHDDGFSYVPRRFFMPILPSVNFYIKWK